jgi:xylan 1,4-beta-xylosidase
MKRTGINCTILSLLFVFCSFSVYSQKLKTENAGASNERVISADMKIVQGKFNDMFRMCIGAGRANEGLRADWQSQLAYVKKECGFKYIRMHGLLTDDMGVYKEDKNGNPRYSWQYIDELYDFLLSIGIRPFVELSFMPVDLASGKQTIFWWKGNITPPKDYKKWEDLIFNLVKHFTERYGENEVASWYFEVWNEPNLNFFFTGTQEEYFKLYDISVKAIKSVSLRYRVGGPATAGSGWVKEMIAHCSQNKVPIDFIATHCYGVKQGYLDEFGETGTILDSNPQSVSGEIKRSRKQIEESPMPGLELHYTEWSSSYTPSDPIHDSYHEAAYILDKIKGVGNTTTSMSYWVFTDIFEEAGPRFTTFHGGFGLLNLQAINKPAFYAFKFLNNLGETELKNSDTASWICKKADGSLQVLFWNFTITHPGDSVNNQVFYKRDLPAKSNGKVKLQIANVIPGKYKLLVYKVGYKVNDAYAAYRELGSPNQLTIDQINKIKKTNDGSPVSAEDIEIKSGIKFSKEFDMRENDVYLVTLENIR